MQKNNRLGRTVANKHDVQTKVLFAKCKKVENNLNDKFRLELMKNRSCYFSPDTKDAQQVTEGVEKTEHPVRVQYSAQEQTDSTLPQDIKDLLWKLKHLLRNVLPEATPSNPLSVTHSIYKDIYDFPKHVTRPLLHRDAEVLTQRQSKAFVRSNRVHIHNEPRVKIIAEKFARYKKENVEIRRLKERIVCVEYDVFQYGSCSKPMQTLRAYFSVRQFCEIEKDIPSIPSAVKRNNKITDEDLKYGGEIGIEIIDAKIPENKSYLEGLKRVLKCQQANRIRKNKNLDPMYLYGMAKQDMLNNDYCYTDLTKAELDEIKDLILRKTSSSLHGITRKRLTAERDTDKQNERKTGNTILDDLSRFIC
ncbi:PREDICTED: uncharacterized protein LOC106105680 isoform X2 [Papilio polytes]|uniref:uncharacterized protein LOC106105680 isoform X2 n=1 Tax=Papilio polytes TaxID=76194 RepID=UPI0006764AD8|nr:PREDICTED: uncharacterized protein LOC106105680 isoform X2 [Papilio polytes]